MIKLIIIIYLRGGASVLKVLSTSVAASASYSLLVLYFIFFILNINLTLIVWIWIFKSFKKIQYLKLK